MATKVKRDPESYHLTTREQDRILDQPVTVTQEKVAVRDKRFLEKLAVIRERMSTMDQKNPQRTLMVVAVGALVVLVMCALVGGLPILLAFLKWGWGVIALFVSVGGLVGLCCLTLIFVGVAAWLALKLGFVKTPSPTPKPKAAPAIAPEKK